MEHATKEGSFDGGDQGLLNTFFSDWATKVRYVHTSIRAIDIFSVLDMRADFSDIQYWLLLGQDQSSTYSPLLW